MLFDTYNSTLFWRIAFVILSFAISPNIVLGQSDRYEIEGQITSEEGPIQDVHVLNLRSRLGTITRSDGSFSIPAQKNDTLIFSNIQYHPLGLVVNEEVLEKSGRLTIEMIPKVEELSEIRLKGHDLKGLFALDSRKSPDSLAYVTEESLAIDSKSFVDPNSSNYVVPQANLLNLFDMIGKKKRKENQDLFRYEESLQRASEDMRKEFGDDVFIHRLGIPKKYINPFIEYCERDQILDHYVNRRIIQVIDILVKNSPDYRNTMGISD